MNNTPVSATTTKAISPQLSQQINSMKAQPKVDLGQKPDTVEIQTPQAKTELEQKPDAVEAKTVQAKAEPEATPVVPMPAEEVKKEPEDTKVKEKKSKEPKEKKEKKSLLEKFANFVGSMKKLGVKIGEYGLGGIKGIGSFVAGGAITAGSIFTIHQVKNGAKIAKEQNTNVIKSIFSTLANGIKRNLDGATLKKTLKSGKGIGTILAAVVVGSLAFLSQIYKAKLNVNEKTADLDHKYRDNVHNA